LKRIRIIAVISAIITALAVYVYLSGIKKPVVIQRVPVVVATVEIREGQEIKQEMVAVKMLPAEAIVSNAATSTDDVLGRISSGTVEPGEQLLVSRFFKAGDADNTLAYALEKGKRAFTVAVDAVSGVAGLIKPRDTVDILLIVTMPVGTAPPQGDQQATSTYSEVLLQSIKVLATGQTLQPSDAKADKSVDTVTLSLTPEQAVKLNLAVSQGRITLVLRSPIDTGTADVQQIDINGLAQTNK
jgi:pilus assembly protein CpaB